MIVSLWCKRLHASNVTLTDVDRRMRRGGGGTVPPPPQKKKKKKKKNQKIKKNQKNLKTKNLGKSSGKFGQKRWDIQAKATENSGKK